ncbi:DUF1579 domain-containing protein [Thalassomonas viridans]|uniref:DUF1579 domain-containing protein n=1 Tax=Thalassomonas viridans TaxID=137584 RepID=A0AAE9Z579_9GAMM|nr:hypothetical protein [Thalassomonas viridans]WDE06828.1 DUF1579 domain-containing protein [Thalassomonas viridans]
MLKEMAAGAPGDFDFAIGEWTVKHRRLKERLTGCHEWIEFEGEMSTEKILGGYGNVEDNQLYFPEGSFRAIALRSYNAETKLWSIWWLDGRFPDALDTPVVGKFSEGVGLFFADDMLDGKPVKVRFTWNAQQAERPRWEQAFSVDNGQSWEINWTMEFRPKG